MIFVTTGTQEPFDRLLKIISLFANDYNEEIIIQAKTSLSFSSNIIIKEFLSPNEFNEVFSRANLVVSHAGMGTILSALQIAKPLIIFPRIASLGEHRNEHQRATANKMKELNLVCVALDETELSKVLKNYFEKGSITSDNKYKIGAYASSSLVESLEEFINE